MSEIIETLPCPFCGGQAKVSNFPGSHNVWCENQPVKCGNRSMYTLAQWNTRCAPCCSGCNGSGYERVLGRDNSEIVIDCSICSASPMVERQDVIGTLRRVGQVIVFDAIGDPHIKDGMEVFTSPAALKKTGD